MDKTINRGYPYPECDPPLTKDASDIAHLRDLAMAVDADVQAVYSRAEDVSIRPDAARMSMVNTLAGTANTVIPFFDSRTFDTTTGNAMTDTANGVMRLVEPGWYHVGFWAMFTAVPFLGLRGRFLRSGVPASAWTSQAEISQANGQMAHGSDEVVSALGGDTLSVELRIGATTPSYTYVCRLWALQVAKG